MKLPFVYLFDDIKLKFSCIFPQWVDYKPVNCITGFIITT